MKLHRPGRVRSARRPGADSLRRGIFLLPTTFTVGNMLCGFAAIIAALHGRVLLAGWLIILAGVLDGLDGRIARLTNSSSEFGKEYDSLADVVSFGVAPAILAYQWGLRGLGRWGWAAAFLFLVAGSVRLARFNVKAHTGDRRFFTGLAIPAGAGAPTVLVLIHPEPVLERSLAMGLWGFVLVISLLMVSTLPYRSFKTVDLRQRWPATMFFLLALVAVALAVFREEAMAVLLAVYILSGPIEWLVRVVRRTPLSAAGYDGDSRGGSSAGADPRHS